MKMELCGDGVGVSWTFISCPMELCGDGVGVSWNFITAPNSCGTVHLPHPLFFLLPFVSHTCSFMMRVGWDWRCAEIGFRWSFNLTAGIPRPARSPVHHGDTGRRCAVIATTGPCLPNPQMGHRCCVSSLRRRPVVLGPALVRS